jgi:hypothetical protein
MRRERSSPAFMELWTLLQRSWRSFLPSFLEPFWMSLSVFLSQRSRSPSPFLLALGVKTDEATGTRQKNKEIGCSRKSPLLDSAPPQGALAQLVRALPCHGRGCGFESRRLRFFVYACLSL